MTPVKVPMVRRLVSTVLRMLKQGFKLARDPDSYKTAIEALSPGDAVTVFASDPIHHPIALYAIQRGIHVLNTLPDTNNFEPHRESLAETRKHSAFIHRAKTQLGDFNYFYSYMSQPKSQLKPFAAWAGEESDISYYFNSHRIDIKGSMMPDRRPVKGTASGGKGTAVELGCGPETEDTTTLLADWMNTREAHKRATGVHTANLTAPQAAGVHSNQYFHYFASQGEIRVNQAKR